MKRPPIDKRVAAVIGVVAIIAIAALFIMQGLKEEKPPIIHRIKSNCTLEMHCYLDDWCVNGSVWKYTDSEEDIYIGGPGGDACISHVLDYGPLYVVRGKIDSSVYGEELCWAEMHGIFSKWDTASRTYYDRPEGTYRTEWAWELMESQGFFPERTETFGGTIPLSGTRYFFDKNGNELFFVAGVPLDKSKIDYSGSRIGTDANSLYVNTIMPGDVTYEPPTRTFQSAYPVPTIIGPNQSVENITC